MKLYIMILIGAKNLVVLYYYYYYCILPITYVHDCMCDLVLCLGNTIMIIIIVLWYNEQSTKLITYQMVN